MKIDPNAPEPTLVRDDGRVAVVIRNDWRGIPSVCYPDGEIIFTVADWLDIAYAAEDLR